jgi:hypothetical protein
MHTQTMHPPLPATAPVRERGAGIFIALIPWVLFTVISHGSVKVASIAALAAAILIAAPGAVKHQPKVLELGAIVAFAGFVAFVFAIDPGAADTISRYGRGIAAAILALIAFGSLLMVPFTEQYARESVPRERWGTPQFKAVNHRLTTMWGCVFAAMVPLHVLAGALDRPGANIVLNWVLPALLVLKAIERTRAVEG